MPAEELPSPERVREAINAAARALGNGRFVYVHGAEGIERTGIVVGCWLAHWGATASAIPGEARRPPPSSSWAATSVV